MSDDLQFVAVLATTRASVSRETLLDITQFSVSCFQWERLEAI
jgi:hypothetical protein